MNHFEMMNQAAQTSPSLDGQNVAGTGSANSLRVAALAPELLLGAPVKNAEHILALWQEADARQIHVILTPELALSGCSCGDLFLFERFDRACREGLDLLLEGSRRLNSLLVLGLPLILRGRRYDLAALLYRGEILGLTARRFAPNHPWRRYFTSAELSASKLLDSNRFGPFELFFNETDVDLATIRPAEQLPEDEQDERLALLPVPSATGELRPSMALILSSQSEEPGLAGRLSQTLALQSAAFRYGLLYAAPDNSESSAETLYAGQRFIFEKGRLRAASGRFNRQEMLLDDLNCTPDFYRILDELPRVEQLPPAYTAAQEAEREARLAAPESLNPDPFLPLALQGQSESARKAKDAYLEELLELQAQALARRLQPLLPVKPILGLSGGLDSALALLCCLRTASRLGIPSTDILAVSMPGPGSSGRTRDQSKKLALAAGVSYREIPIGPAIEQHLAAISHPADSFDVTFENAQARERTQILMDLANQQKGLVIGTGDLSEAALGWCTYNGDQMAMYNVNISLPKTLIRHLVAYACRYYRESLPDIGPALQAILDTPVSPELVKRRDSSEITQATEEILGPYLLHDFFIWHFIGLKRAPAEIEKLARQAFAGQFKAKLIRETLLRFLKRFFSQQFKRAAAPEGAGLGLVSLSPRSGLLLPSDLPNAVFETFAADLPPLED